MTNARNWVIVSYRDFGYSFRSVHQARNICSAASPPSGRAALAGQAAMCCSRGGSLCGSTRRPCPQAHRSSARGGGRTGRGSSLARWPAWAARAVAARWRDWPGPARAVAARWRDWPACRIFPSMLAYSTALLTSETATRVGIAPQASCTSALEPALAQLAARDQCMAALRATYVDQLQGACCTRSACWRSRARTTRPRSPPGCPPARRTTIRYGALALPGTASSLFQRRGATGGDGAPRRPVRRSHRGPGACRRPTGRTLAGSAPGRLRARRAAGRRADRRAHAAGAGELRKPCVVELSASVHRPGHRPARG